MALVDRFVEKLPKQHQEIQPGIEEEMRPLPIFDMEGYNYSCDRLKGKVAIITGGDSGIGRAVAVGYAREGAKVVISYLNEDVDAKKTEEVIKSYGGECILVRKDITKEENCKYIVEQCIKAFGKVDILINNAGVQYPQYDICDITQEQLEKTFKTNIFSAFYLSKAVIPHMKFGSCIINTTSIVAYRGNEKLLDYSASKGALTSFTRSLALNLAEKGIRVNAVAPGPVWTPLIVSSFSAEEVEKFGENREFSRVAQPVELVEPYIYLASQAASYVTGTTIHIDGGKISNT